MRFILRKPLNLIPKPNFITMKEVLDFLIDIHPLSAECIAYLGSIIQPLPITEGDTIVKIGEVDDKMYFMKEGLLDSFTT
jgi:hypothetical protein